MKLRPQTTLFLLTSIDGKISTGDNDRLDFDRDLPKIKGVKEGLQQYYDIEKTTDLFSFISGRVLAKIGVNKSIWSAKPLPVSFVVVDNKPHLTKKGLEYISRKGKRLFLVTTNRKHPAFSMRGIETVYYPKQVNFPDLFKKLFKQYGIKRITIQTGGTLNATLIRAGLIDRLSLVIAPLMVGGKDTASLMDGDSLETPSQLPSLKAFKLISVKRLKNSYLHLRYETTKRFQ